MAVFCLPPEMFGFYKYHIDYVTAHAVDPDKRRYAIEGEAACHFMDLDRYGLQPFDSIPARWNDAISKFTEDSLMAHGIVPWSVQRTYFRLVNAFEKKDVAAILRYSSDLGHYVGDAHVPLHTTSNYNGQKTNQHGIHGLWESRIPELSMESYILMAGRCAFVDDPLARVWDVLRESHSALDSVLLFEKELTSRFPEDQKLTYELRGATAVRVYSAEFTNEYERMMDGMVERRMEASIQLTSSLWYTAWVMAGQPDLNALLDWQPSQEELEKSNKEQEEWLKRVLNVPEHDH
ncbi:MAG: zinc dependent phospholipase C family protein [Bacteroidota bacterium]